MIRSYKYSFNELKQVLQNWEKLAEEYGGEIDVSKFDDQAVPPEAEQRRFELRIPFVN
jgi:hypothetical protein